MGDAAANAAGAVRDLDLLDLADSLLEVFLSRKVVVSVNKIGRSGARIRGGRSLIHRGNPSGRRPKCREPENSEQSSEHSIPREHTDNSQASHVRHPLNRSTDSVSETPDPLLRSDRGHDVTQPCLNPAQPGFKPHPLDPAQRNRHTMEAPKRRNANLASKHPPSPRLGR